MAALYQVSNGMIEVEPEFKQRVVAQLPEIVANTGNVPEHDRAVLDQVLKEFLGKTGIDVSVRKISTSDAQTQTDIENIPVVEKADIVSNIR